MMNERGHAAIETALMSVILIGAFIAIVEVTMLCVRGELLSYAAARVARLGTVYGMTQDMKNDVAAVEAAVALPDTWIDDASPGNRTVRPLALRYANTPVSGINIFPTVDALTVYTTIVPTLPPDLPDAAFGGDNPLPYCESSDEELKLCPPREAT